MVVQNLILYYGRQAAASYWLYTIALYKNAVVSKIEVSRTWTGGWYKSSVPCAWFKIQEPVSVLVQCGVEFPLTCAVHEDVLYMKLCEEGTSIICLLLLASKWGSHGWGFSTPSETQYECCHLNLSEAVMAERSPLPQRHSMSAVTWISWVSLDWYVYRYSAMLAWTSSLIWEVWVTLGTMLSGCYTEVACL